jgi:hypothetical protein
MRRASKKLLYWAPRASSIAFALFISLFALDAFDGNLPFGKQLLAFAIHLIPVYLIVIVLALAWKRESVGGAGFIILGLLYMGITRLRFQPLAYVIISGPAFLVGLLFLVSWLLRRKLRPSA